MRSASGVNYLFRISSKVELNHLHCLQYDHLAYSVESNLYIMVTLGKWPGDHYIQGDRYIQVSFKLYSKLMNNVFVEIQ